MKKYTRNKPSHIPGSFTLSFISDRCGRKYNFMKTEKQALFFPTLKPITSALLMNVLLQDSLCKGNICSASQIYGVEIWENFVAFSEYMNCTGAV
jgi:hypothetical protein